MHLFRIGTLNVNFKDIFYLTQHFKHGFTDLSISRNFYFFPMLQQMQGRSYKGARRDCMRAQTPVANLLITETWAATYNVVCTA